MVICWIAGAILWEVVNTVSAQVNDSCLPLSSPPSFDNEQEILDFVGFNITCAVYDIEVSMSTCALRQLGYNPTTELAAGNFSSPSVLVADDLDDPTCIPYDDGLGSTVFRFNLTSCHPTIIVEESGANMSYLYSIRNVVNGSGTEVLRIKRFSIPFSCGFPLSMRDSLEFSILGVYLHSPVRMKTQRRLQNVFMGVFRDSSFRLPITTQPNEFPKVNLAEPIRVGLTLDSDETYLALEASSCWVTNSPSPNDPHRFDILKNGCPISDAESNGLVRLLRNFNATTVEMSFRPFTWGYMASHTQNGQILHIHCKVSICDWVLDQKCIEKYCPEVEPGANLGDGKDVSKVITLGPIAVTAESTICSHANGGCSHFCSLDRKGARICHCPTLSVLDSDGRNCRNKEIKKGHLISKRSLKTNSRIDISYVWLIALVVFVGLVLVTSLSKVGKSRRSGKGRLDL